MAVIAALTLPQNEGEGMDQFAERIAADAETIRDAAAYTGTMAHKAIKNYCVTAASGKHPSFADLANSPIYQHMVYFDKWFKENIVSVQSAEKVVVGNINGQGYAGMMDLMAVHKDHGLCVLDFKTQKFRGGKPTFYEEWGVQIAAYDFAVPDYTNSLVSLAINSSEPMPVVEKVWTPEERHKADLVWAHLLPLFYAMKGL